MSQVKHQFIYRGDLRAIGVFHSQLFVESEVDGNIIEIYFKAEGVTDFSDSWYFGLKVAGTNVLIGTDRPQLTSGDLAPSKTGLSIPVNFLDKMQPTVDARGGGTINGPVTIIIIVDDGLGDISIGDPVGSAADNGVLYADGSGDLKQDATRFAYQENEGNQGSLKLGNVADTSIDSGIDISKSLMQIVDRTAYTGNLDHSYFGLFSSVNRGGNNSFFQTSAVRGRATYSGSSPDGPGVTGGEFFADNAGSTDASCFIQGTEGIAAAHADADQVQGAAGFANVLGGVTITDFAAGIFGIATATATSTISKFCGLFYELFPGGTIAQLIGIYIKVLRSTAGTITDLFGIKIGDWTGSTTGVTNSYGIYIDSSIDVGATIKRAIKSLSTSISEFAGAVHVPDDAYDATTWDANTEVPTKNALRDKIEPIVTSLALKALDSAVVHNTGAETVAGVKTFSSTPIVPDDAYDSTTWNTNFGVPTKNAVRDKIEALLLAGGYSDEQAQDAIGAMIDTTIEYVDATPLLRRAALTGDVTAPAGSNATMIANDAVTTAKILNSNVTLAKLTNIADQTILGNNTGGAAAPVALTAAQVKTLLGLVIGTNVQAWDADLDALAALAGTNTIYYRSAANTWTAVTIGSNLTFSGGTLSSSGGGGGGITFTEVTGTSQSAAVANGYITNNAALVTVTLPSTAAVGDIVIVRGSGAGGWKIAQNASQVVKWTAGGVAASTETTTGTGGFLASTDRYDTVELQCIGANNTWIVANVKGNIQIA